MAWQQAVQRRRKRPLSGHLETETFGRAGVGSATAGCPPAGFGATAVKRACAQEAFNGQLLRAPAE
jgi:hypothetical protein